MHTIAIEDCYPAWRRAALEALANHWPPELIEWRLVSERDDTDGMVAAVEEQRSFDYRSNPQPCGGVAAGPASRDEPPRLRISKDFAEQLQDAALFRDPQRWAFLYKLLWRWHQGDRAVASPADADGARLYKMAKSVRRDKHDMIAYVRFRKRAAGAEAPDAADAPQPPAIPAIPEYVAWYAPEHEVLPWAAEHFAQRMGRASWLITTPRAAALWDGQALHLDSRRALGARYSLSDADSHADAFSSAKSDAIEALWLAYYQSIFNPARLNEMALEQHMPVRFWKDLPEARLIPAMVSEARSGAQRLAQASSVGGRSGKSVSVEAEQAQPTREQPSSLDECRRCDLWQNATQAVGGAGPHKARIMLIGEQPGDQEDLAGRAFVGPAGQLLDEALARAALPRDSVYLTNAVKHFKWTPRGKRRMHKTPSQREVEACSYWLEHELKAVAPAVIVTLGATALGALLHGKVSLREHLEKPFEVDGSWVVATYHPSFALRQRDQAEREQVLEAISGALGRARELSASLQAGTAGTAHRKAAKSAPTRQR
ncbi:MAG: UdgX family uracil-DNA binding protein [Janthinobacterium lividum]